MPNITFSFQPDCEAPTEAKGGWKLRHLGMYIVDRINILIDGKAVGYLKIAHISSSRVKNVKSIWDFKSSFDGWCLGDGPNTLWQRAHLYAKRSPVSCPTVPFYMLTDAHAPEPRVRDEDLRLLSLNYLGGLNRFLSDSTDFAYVDYIDVKESFQRQGLGTLLYNVGAMWLAVNRKLPLHSSPTQSLAAKKAWKSMISSKKYPIISFVKEGRYRESLNGDKRREIIYHKLDYVSDVRWRLRARKRLERLRA